MARSERYLSLRPWVGSQIPDSTRLLTIAHDGIVCLDRKVEVISKGQEHYCRMWPVLMGDRSVGEEFVWFGRGSYPNLLPDQPCWNGWTMILGVANKLGSRTAYAFGTRTTSCPG